MKYRIIIGSWLVSLGLAFASETAIAPTEAGATVLPGPTVQMSLFTALALAFTPPEVIADLVRKGRERVGLEHGGK
jgi:hypothetical protein